jgi:outer membrane receptor protein involved in Fe transport
MRKRVRIARNDHMRPLRRHSNTPRPQPVQAEVKRCRAGAGFQRYVCTLPVALWLCAASALAEERLRFSIPAGNLADALDCFSEQSGLQTVYAAKVLTDRQTAAITGALLPSEALDRMLGSSELVWRFVNDTTVLLSLRHDETGASGAASGNDTGLFEGAAGLNDIVVFADPRRILPSDPSAATFGLGKPLLETPRSLSVISEETIDLFSLSAVEDLLRVVPAVYTTTRFGIQGSIDVRNVSADTYVRGMKRLNLQGHGRSVLGATDSIEIVRGPPSPLYGMGKIGGYTNVVPKSGRARLGGYLAENQGFTQLITGEYGRSEISFGLGGPLAAGSEHGGFYLYGLLEDSDTWTRNVGVGQVVLQSALSLDDFAGPFRLEAGIDYQRSTTSGALLNRFNQQSVDDKLYIRGTPLATLDRNGNGAIGFLEMHQASPVKGELGSGNQPLIQRWDWPLDAQGRPLPLDRFPRVSGIPQALYDYLLVHPEADPSGLLRAAGPGGPLPASGYVPLGFALDPRTTGFTELDPRRAGAWEREVRADFMLAFFDLVYDLDPDFTVKNQLFFDSMDQAKLSEQPGGGKQDVQVLENKFTMTRQLSDYSAWLQLKGLLSLNVRNTRASGYRYVGDQGSHRTDAAAGAGTMTPNTTFVHPFDNPDITADGAPWFSDYRSDYWEAGMGGILDIDAGDKTKVLLGARLDRSRAKNIEYAGTFDPFSGTSAQPGRVRTADDGARGYDTGVSWNLSVSRRLPFNTLPYVTVAESSLTLESNNNRMPNAVIRHGHVGKARLVEAGVKAGLLDERLFFSLAHYRQERLDVTEENSLALESADASATSTRGWEMELKWVPVEALFVSMYAVHQRTRFLPNSGDNILVDARTLGFTDIRDDTGKVLYPAEAYLYGGRSFLALPAGMEAYAEKQGNPDTQAGVSAQYQLNESLGFTLSANYFSSVHTGRLRQVRLPSSQVYNAGIHVDRGKWHWKLDLGNLLDERYFRPRTGENLGETLVSAMPGRSWLVTLRLDL